MKRSYPYTGPGASPSQPQSQQISTSTTPSNQQTTDYSSYGYGGNNALMAGNSSAGLSQEAQQAQWHQQWQQYYAQQAASTAGGQTPQSIPQTRPPLQQQQQQQQQLPQQNFGFQQQPQQQQPQGQYYGQQQFPPQASMPQTQQMPTAPYTWPQQQQPFHGNPNHQQAGFYNASMSQNNALPPAKRPRFDMNNQQHNSARPMGPSNQMGYQPANQAGPSIGIGPQAFPSAINSAAGNQGYGGNTAWQQNGNHNAGSNVMRPGPMRGGGGSLPHFGGPSNMAGPMAGTPNVRAPNTPMADRRGGTPNRPSRPQTIPSRPSAPSGANSGKFNGPVGVNALTSQGRGGIAARGGGSPMGPCARRPIAGLRNSGIPSGPSGKGNRFDRNKGKAAAVINKSPAGKTASNFELNKASAVNGRVTTLADQPVPSSSKRTFSDFKIKAISIDPIDWTWLQEEEYDAEEEDVGEEEEATQSNNDTDSVDGSVASRKKTRSGKRRDKNEVSKELSRLRICFAANQPPPGAPTGPKALSKPVEKEEIDETKSIEETFADADNSVEPEWTAFSRGPPQSSTNRISISYASTKRRLVIDSDVIKSIEINRAECTMKISIMVTTAAGVKRKDQLEKKKGEEWVVLRGVLLEGREGEMDNFGAVSRRELEKCWRGKGEVEPSAVTADSSEKIVEEEEEAKDDTQMGIKKEEVEEDEEIAEATKTDTTAEGRAEEENDVAEGDAKEKEEAVAWQDYASLPPFYRLLNRHDGPKEDENHSAAGSTEMVITVFLAEVSPKQELRWIKTGDLEDWLSALPGFQSSFASSSTAKVVHAWTDKIHVLDPDPPPTLADVLEDWSVKSFVGSMSERKRFLETQRLQTLSGITDLICKLVRGERATPCPNIRELGTPLKEAMESTTFHQNHLTLSIFSIARLVKEFASLAKIPEEMVDARIQEIFMCLPTLLIFRACDGLLKESMEKQRLLNNAAGPRRVVVAKSDDLAKGEGSVSSDGSLVASKQVVEKKAEEEGIGKSKEEDSSGRVNLSEKVENGDEVAQGDKEAKNDDDDDVVVEEEASAEVKIEAIEAEEPREVVEAEAVQQATKSVEFLSSLANELAQGQA